MFPYTVKVFKLKAIDIHQEGCATIDCSWAPKPPVKQRYVYITETGERIPETFRNELAEPGDYIIVHPNDLVTICKPEKFADNYKQIGMSNIYHSKWKALFHTGDEWLQKLLKSCPPDQDYFNLWTGNKLE